MLLTAAQPIWSLPLSDAYAALQSGPEGLSSAEAAARLERFGANRLPPLKRRPLLLRFTDQLIHFMALLLWVATGFCVALGLGAACVRFRDIQPAVAGGLQLGLLATPVLWRADQLGTHGVWLLANPFHTMLEILRDTKQDLPAAWLR